MNSSNHDHSPRSEEPAHDDWVACAPGTFKSMRSARRVQPKHDWQPYVWGICLGLLAAGSAVTVKSWLPEPTPARMLVCQEVQPLLVAYAAGDLDRQTGLQVRDHLAICKHCRASFEGLASSPYHHLLREVSPARARPLLAIAD